MEIVYFSNHSGNTHRFVEKLETPFPTKRIPILWDDTSPLIVSDDFVLIVPTYGAGRGDYAVPRSVIKFLNIEQNRNNIRGVIGTGNTNFGEHYCLAAEIVAYKTNVPVLYKAELLGTPEDVNITTERIQELWTKTTATTN